MQPFSAVMKMRHRDTVLVLVILILSIVLLVVPSGFESPFAQDVERPRGQVLEVDNSNILQFGLVKTGSQTLRVRILDGPHAGQEVDAGNTLLGKMDIDKLFRVGDTAFLVLDLDGDRLVSATAYDHYRLDTELLLFLLFAVLLIGFAGWSGARALLSFVFAVLLIWRVLIGNGSMTSPHRRYSIIVEMRSLRESPPRSRIFCSGPRSCPI